MFPSICQMVKSIGWLPENYPDTGLLMNILIQDKSEEIKEIYYNQFELRLYTPSTLFSSSPSHNAIIKNII